MTKQGQTLYVIKYTTRQGFGEAAFPTYLEALTRANQLVEENDAHVIINEVTCLDFLTPDLETK